MAKYFYWLQLAAWSTAMDDRLFSVGDAAKYLGGISKYTIHAWLSSGKLRRTKVGSRTMIRESDLQAFVDKCNSSPNERQAVSSAVA
jgi:excisionase family DNA binding protein